MKEFAIAVLWIGYEARPEYLGKRGEDDSQKKNSKSKMRQLRETE